MYKLRIPEYLANDIRSLHPDIKKKIKHALKAIINDPNEGKAAATVPRDPLRLDSPLLVGQSWGGGDHFVTAPFEPTFTFH